MDAHEETTQNFVLSGQYSKDAQAVQDMDGQKQGRKKGRKEGRKVRNL